MEKQQPVKNPIKKKQSHKKSSPPTQSPQTPTQSSPTQQAKNVKKPVSHKQKNVGVSFNIKNNVVEKFYCPQVALTKVTKTSPIDLNSIPDLPEIPLDSLLGNR
jgi:hypothetical protein